MKPGPVYFGHGTYDLTEGKVHRYEVDGISRTVMLFPKKWEKSGPAHKVSAVNGTVHEIQSYIVTEWDEVPLCDVGPAESQ